MLEELKAPDFPEAIELDAERRYEFLSFWLGRMVRERAVRLPGTPNEWIGNRESGIRLNADSGKFEPLMRVRLGSSFYSEQLSGGQQGLKPWQRFLQERFGIAGRADGYLVDPKRLAIDLAYPNWVRCDVCTFAMPDHALYREICPECGAISSLKKLSPDNKDVYEVFQTRKGFYRKDIDNESHDLRPFVAEEHTAAIGAIDAQDAFSRAEWHEMRFQDLDVLGPGGERGGIVDILSCTTTMEVGIDIGSLTAVSLRNVPPNRANYQQRAGRAGRRGSSLSTVITYADQGTHDQRYFKNPADMISGPVTDPVLNLENTEIVRRHGFAMILSMFQRERIPALAHNAATANIFSSLGRVSDFRAGAETEFSFRGLQKWLVEHRTEVLSSLRSIVPAEYLESKEAEEIDAIPDRLLARLQAIGCDEIDPQADALPEQQNVAIWGGFDDDFFGDDELRINAKSPKEKALYCRLLGKHLFGSEDCFPTGVKYSLEPLREFGFDALSPGDIDGIRDVKLVELWLGDPDERYGVITIRKGDDLFNWAQGRNKDIHIKRRLISATFKLQMFGRKSELVVTVRPPNVAMYNRGPIASIIEAWLAQRGFIISGLSTRKPRHEPILVSV